MKRRQIKITIAAPIVLGIIITIAFSAYIFVGVSVGNRIVRDRLTQDNHALLSISSNILFNPLYEQNVSELINLLDELVAEADIDQATIHDQTGNLIAHASTRDFSIEEEKIQALSSQALQRQEIIQIEADENLLISGPISAGAEQIGTLDIIFNLNSLKSSIRSLFAAMLLTGIGTLLAVIFIGNLITQVFEQTIRSFVEAANQIGQGDLEVSIPIINLEEPAAVGAALETMQDNLKRLYNDLEKQVLSQERRANYLEATSAIAKDMAAVLDLPTLLSRSINLIDENFDYYRQSIFLVDSTGDWVVLHAASGEDVERTVERGLRVSISDQGIVAHVAASKEAYVAQNVHDDPLFLSDDETIIIQSELALPLISRGEIIGVLDVQSTKLGDFSKEDSSVLQTLADQIALAITNARLFEETQASLTVIQRAYGELSREKWSEMLESREQLGYYSDAGGVVQLADYVERNQEVDTNLPTLDVPIAVRGYHIGRISARKPPGAGKWSSEEIALIESLTEQLNLALESARLYEDSQRRATQEQLTSEITTRIRETLDLETILETAVNEIGTAMGLSALEVQLGSFSSNDQEL
jgi:GAF domain-containing protein/HAMP domain-containing protein